MPARRLPAASRRAGVLSILAVLPTRLLIANRGEIAIRIARAAAELGIPHRRGLLDDDAGSLHARRAEDARCLAGSGPAAYLDQAGLIAVASEAGCDAIHPGYGFLSENAAFARRCAEAGLCFVGPRAEMLELFGDKARGARPGGALRRARPARARPARRPSDDAREFLASLGAGGVEVLKAVAGGGGRGMRVVRHADEVDEACERCRVRGECGLRQRRPLRRAAAAAGAPRRGADHRRRTGAVTHLWERECSLQRRHQKLIEMAPSPGLPAALRERLLDAALRMAAEVRYDNLGTFEFLVDASDVRDDRRSPSSRPTRGSRSSTRSPRR